MISGETEQKVKDFYEYDDVSSVMPGQKVTKSVKIGGKKMILQKCLITRNLKQIFSKFISGNPHIKIGFANFCSLRPEHCVLAGSGGTHVVCVCPIHENMNLMALGNKKSFHIIHDNIF